jgi:putative ABC transport system ATP-binding protein
MIERVSAMSHPTKPLRKEHSALPRGPRTGDLNVAPPLRVGNGVAARAVDVVKTYGSGDTVVHALDHVSVEIGRGEFTAVMGPSGSGKSTLMHCLAGLDSVTSGSVAIGDVELAGLSDKKLTALRRDRIGFVFQAFNLVPTLTAIENITLPIAIAGRKPDTQWLDVVIKTLGLQDRLKHRPSELSGGQQQRVAVGRALAAQPDIVFGDEPTGNLDSRSSDEVLGILRRSVNELGQTVVIVTHDPRAAAYADRVLFLADGRIVDELRSPTADSVLERMKKLETRWAR